MAAGARATGAHYALKLKANNAPPFACVQAAFATAGFGDSNRLHKPHFMPPMSVRS
jgi:hypothetical protein